MNQTPPTDADDPIDLLRAPSPGICGRAITAAVMLLVMSSRHRLRSRGKLPPGRRWRSGRGGWPREELVIAGQTQPVQRVLVEIARGSQRGQRIEVLHGETTVLTEGTCGCGKPGAPGACRRAGWRAVLLPPGAGPRRSSRRCCLPLPRRRRTPVGCALVSRHQRPRHRRLHHPRHHGRTRPAARLPVRRTVADDGPLYLTYGGPGRPTTAGRPRR